MPCYCCYGMVATRVLQLHSNGGGWGLAGGVSPPSQVQVCPTLPGLQALILSCFWFPTINASRHLAFVPSPPCLRASATVKRAMAGCHVKDGRAGEGRSEVSGCTLACAPVHHCGVHALSVKCWFWGTVRERSISLILFRRNTQIGHNHWIENANQHPISTGAK